MVPWLLERGGAGVDELVERFGGTREEILGDLDTLGYCGLPGYGGGDLVEVTVFGDRVSVRMADFFSRPLSLSVKEAIALLLSARALATVDALPESGPLDRAAAKLEALLGAEAAVAGGRGAPRGPAPAAPPPAGARPPGGGARAAGGPRGGGGGPRRARASSSECPCWTR
jgi:predicted DNA-binding transcriptional regulator YafY